MCFVENIKKMKNSILLLAITILLSLATTAQAQKNEESDYNLRKAYELLENKEEAEAIKYINKQIEEYPKSVNAYGRGHVCFLSNRNLVVLWQISTRPSNSGRKTVTLNNTHSTGGERSSIRIWIWLISRWKIMKRPINWH